MTVAENLSPAALLRLRVTADDDPSVLTRLLGYFQNLNVTPRRVSAVFGSNAVMHVEVDVCGFPAERLSVIAARVLQTPCVRCAYWHHL
jgi:hypothetical protein